MEKAEEYSLSELMEEMRLCVNDLLLEIYINGLIENDSKGKEFPRSLARARTATFLSQYADDLQQDFDQLEDVLYSSKDAIHIQFIV